MKNNKTKIVVTEILSLFKLAKKEWLYFILMATATALGFLRTIIYGSFLSPADMGFLTVTVTMAGYGIFLQLGILSGLNRELPILYGKNKTERASKYLGQAIMSIVFFQLIGILILIPAIFTYYKDSDISSIFPMSAALSFSASFGQMALLRLRAEQHVLQFSIMQFAIALITVLGGIFAIKASGYKGAIIVMIVLNIIIYVFSNASILSAVDYSYFSIKDIRYLIRIGFPMMLSGVLLNLQSTMDRFFIIKYLSFHEIGIYQMGYIPIVMGFSIAGIISQYSSPKLLFHYGQTNSLTDVFKKSFIVSINIILIMLLLAPVFYIIVNLTLDNFLAAYRGSLPLFPIFYVGAIFVSANLSIVLNAANRQIFLLVINSIVTGICFLSYSLIAHFHGPLTLYAYANSAAQILNFVIVTIISYFLAIRSTEKTTSPEMTTCIPK